jgi:hypothetical protein
MNSTRPLACRDFARKSAQSQNCFLFERLPEFFPGERKNVPQSSSSCEKFWEFLNFIDNNVLNGFGERKNPALGGHGITQKS